MRTWLLSAFFIALLCGDFDAKAQMQPALPPRNPKCEAVTGTILKNQQQCYTAGKSTRMKSRLSGYSDYTPAGLQDTMHFFYTGAHGSRPFPSNGFSNYILAGNDGFVNIQADSSLIYTTDNNSALVLAQRMTAHYQPDNRLSSETFESYDPTDPEYDKTTFLYNAKGYYVFTEYLEAQHPLPGNLTPTYGTYSNYDSYNRLVYDSTVYLPTAMPDVKEEYTYNAVGNLVLYKYFARSSSSSFIVTDSIAYTYNADNLLLYYSWYTFFQGAVYDAYIDSFGYDGNRPLYLFRQEKSYYPPNGYGWVIDYHQYNHLTTNGNDIDTSSFIYYYPTGGVQGLSRTISAFNSDGSVSETDNYSYYNGIQNSIPDNRRHFYYDFYEDLAVDNASAPPKLLVYPNPATKKICITLNDQTRADQTGYLMLTDALGRDIITKALNGQAVTEVLIDQLQAGRYSVRLIDGNDRAYQACAFSKL